MTKGTKPPTDPFNAAREAGSRLQSNVAKLKQRAESLKKEIAETQRQAKLAKTHALLEDVGAGHVPSEWVLDHMPEDTELTPEYVQEWAVTNNVTGKPPEAPRIPSSGMTPLSPQQTVIPDSYVPKSERMLSWKEADELRMTDEDAYWKAIQEGRVETAQTFDYAQAQKEQRRARVAGE